MSGAKKLSISDISKTLNCGKATVKFILTRFEKWLPCEFIDGQPFYDAVDIRKIIYVQQSLDAGDLPEDIEKELEHFPRSGASNYAADQIVEQLSDSCSNGDIRLNKDGLHLLKSLFNDIGEQQKRIAIAQEKRAEAEERKAAAIEKRADAEEKKIQAMNSIASALQEMNQIRGAAGPEAGQIVHKAATVIADDQDTENDEPPTPEMDDLSTLLEDPEEISDPIPSSSEMEVDDLSQLVDQTPETQDPEPEIDDLSALIDENAVSDSGGDDMVESTSDGAPPIDDLSQLIDSPQASEIKEEQQPAIDDLSQLLETTEDSIEPDENELSIDDLSLLIEKETDISSSEGTDDLSQLIDEPLEESVDEMDDLSQLIDIPEKTDEEETEKAYEIHIDASPEDGLEKYKSVVMKTIIQMKTDGLTQEETTRCLNDHNIQTLSGKSEWSLKAISQIYKFIESAT